MSVRRRVLVTGGSGSIATGFAAHAADRYDLVLLDLPGRFTAAHGELGELVEADVADLEAVRAAMVDVDTVVHLAGERSPSALWSRLLPTNVVGTYNVVAAAIAAGCRRVVYASSVHAVSGAGDLSGVRESDPVAPGDLYGVTKCFGEALGAYAAAREGLSFIALRIGAYQPIERIAEPRSGWMLRDYTAPDDLHRLMTLSIDADGVGFEIYNAVSGNRFGRLSMEKARRELGYVPVVDAFAESAPFREAVDVVGGLDDKEFPSGMRDDILRPIGSAST